MRFKLDIGNSEGPKSSRPYNHAASSLTEWNHSSQKSDPHGGCVPINKQNG